MAASRGRGLPNLARVVVPFPFDSLPEEKIREHIRQRLSECCGALTTQARDTDQESSPGEGGIEPGAARLSAEGDVEAITTLMYEKGWTDGLPVIPPTEEKVKRMVDGAGKPGRVVVGTVPPAFGAATIESIAVNAVMAGCRPEYMPVLIAAVEAMCDPIVRLNAIQVSTMPTAPALIINGPVRAKLGINSDSNCLGPGWQANATIGRAVRLILLNIGGGAPGTVDKATQGFPGKYTLCFGENEEQSPWPPFHVEKGFAPEQSTVTVVGVNGTIGLDDSSPDPHCVVDTIVKSGLIVPSAYNFIDPGAQPILVLNPIHAQQLKSIGYDKQRLREHVFEHARIPVEFLCERRRFLRLRDSSVLEVNGMVPITERPENIIVIVAGGEQGIHSTWLPTGLGQGAKAATRPVIFP